MEWYQDSLACLSFAKSQLKEIERLEKESALKIDVLPSLKVNIKNTLENCRSPLDYAANYINSQHPTFSSSTPHSKFPVLRKKKNSEFNIKKALKCAPDAELIRIIQECQINKDWLKNLTTLVNLNKHNNLTHHDTRNTSYIEYMNIGGNHFHGITFEGNGIDVQIGDKSYSGSEILNIHPEIVGEFTRTYYFQNVSSKDKEVKKILQEIIKETETVINQLYNYLSK